MDPINYITQVQDPVSRAIEGYEQGRGIVAANQQMQVNDQNMAVQLDELALSERRVDQADRSLDQSAQRIAMDQQQIAMQQQQIAMQQQAQLDAQSRSENLRNDLSALIENEGATAIDYQRLAARNPEFAQQIMAPWENINAERKERDLLELAQIHNVIEAGAVDLATEMLTTRRDAARNAGLEQDAAAADAMIKYLEIDPRMARAMTGTALAVLGDGRFDAVLDAGRSTIRSTKILDDGTTVTVRDDGVQVTNAADEVLKGQAAIDAVRQAQEFSAEVRGDRSNASETGRLEARIDIGGDAEFELARGGARGTASVVTEGELVEMQRNMPSLRVVVDQLYDLSNTATYTQSGQLRDAAARELGLPVGKGAIARAEYIAIVDNQVLPLLRQTFGAQFTVQEGETLRATLGAPDRSPEEKHAVLRSFIAQKERDLAARLEEVPRNDAPQAPQAPGSDLDSLLMEFQ